MLQSNGVPEQRSDAPVLILCHLTALDWPIVPQARPKKRVCVVHYIVVEPTDARPVTSKTRQVWSNYTPLKDPTENGSSSPPVFDLTGSKNQCSWRMQAVRCGNILVHKTSFVCFTLAVSSFLQFVDSYTHKNRNTVLHKTNEVSQRKCCCTP